MINDSRSSTPPYLKAFPHSLTGMATERQLQLLGEAALLRIELDVGEDGERVPRAHCVASDEARTRLP